MENSETIRDRGPGVMATRFQLGEYRGIPDAATTEDAELAVIYMFSGCVVVIVVVFVAIASFIALRRYCGRSWSEGKTINLSEVNPVYEITPDNSLTSDPYELHWDWLELLEKIGEGEFGRVMKARVRERNPMTSLTHGNYVAVKMLREYATDDHARCMRTEINLLKEIGRHRNIVNLIGCMTRGPSMALVMDYCPLGDLRRYLLKYKEQKQSVLDLAKLNSLIPSLDQTLGAASAGHMDPTLLSFASQIAAGMVYLSNQKYVHRDLAARNILMYDDTTVKIADFGLSRDVCRTNQYTPCTNRPLPYKWMSLEAILDGVFTTMGDVWSFGIVLWEIMTYGQTPYPGIYSTDLINRLKAGYRMSKPDACSYSLYELMLQCWQDNPSHRPDFFTAHTVLESLIDEQQKPTDLSTCPEDSTYHRLEESGLYEDIGLSDIVIPRTPRMYMYSLTPTDLTHTDDEGAESDVELSSHVYCPMKARNSEFLQNTPEKRPTKPSEQLPMKSTYDRQLPKTPIADSSTTLKSVNSPMYMNCQSSNNTPKPGNVDNTTDTTPTSTAQSIAHKTVHPTVHPTTPKLFPKRKSISRIRPKSPLVRSLTETIKTTPEKIASQLGLTRARRNVSSRSLKTKNTRVSLTPQSSLAKLLSLNYLSKSLSRTVMDNGHYDPSSKARYSPSPKGPSMV